MVRIWWWEGKAASPPPPMPHGDAWAASFQAGATPSMPRSAAPPPPYWPPVCASSRAHGSACIPTGLLDACSAAREDVKYRSDGSPGNGRAREPANAVRSSPPSTPPTPFWWWWAEAPERPESASPGACAAPSLPVGEQSELVGALREEVPPVTPACRRFQPSRWLQRFFTAELVRPGSRLEMALHARPTLATWDRMKASSSAVHSDLFTDGAWWL
mmetsp:Transcript_26098/g.76536  ORF Transcript_26098/g.76536 Transcript_26098/m.76536 type:complete len:216 (-) Transcript_26098:292-939(-)